MSHTKRMLPIALAVTATFATAAVAQPPGLHVDQEQPAIDAGSLTLAIGGPSEQMLAQTVTVGLDGRLAEVRFPIGCEDGVLDVEIQGTTATGEPDGVVLVRRSFAASRLPGVVPATFETLGLPRRLAVSPGDTLAIVLRNDSGSCGLASPPAGDTYPGGQAFFDARPNPPGWLPLSPVADLPFQTVVFGRVP